MKLLQRGGLGPRERLAARLRLAEKRILQSTMDAVRRRATLQPLSWNEPDGDVLSTALCPLLRQLLHEERQDPDA